MLTFIYLFFFFNTTYISFDYDILLEFFIHLDCVKPNSRGQDMSYHSIQGLSPSHMACSPRDFRSSFFLHTFSLLYVTLSLYSYSFCDMFSTRPV